MVCSIPVETKDDGRMAACGESQMTETRTQQYRMVSSPDVSDRVHVDSITNPLDSTQIRDMAAAERRARDAEEPLLQSNPGRFVLFPIRHADMWKMAKQQEAVGWHASDMDLSKDWKDWVRLKDGEQHFIKRVLGFFAGSDGIVNENIASNFMSEVQVPEARAFYAFQIAIEQVHAETYSLLIDTYITDPIERDTILQSIQTVPCIERKAAWAIQWMNREAAGWATRLMAFAVVEGIFFSGAFCSIYWLKQRGIMPGLTFSNEYIQRDEGLHTDFACLLYSKCRHKLTVAQAHTLVREAVEIETEFITEALPCSLIGMSAPRMTEYIQFVADRLLVALGYPRLWGTANPFSWMELQSLQGKTNFFEKKNGEYELSGVGVSGSSSMADLAVTMDEEF